MGKQAEYFCKENTQIVNQCMKKKLKVITQQGNTNQNHNEICTGIATINMQMKTRMVEGLEAWELTSSAGECVWCHHPGKQAGRFSKC